METIKFEDLLNKPILTAEEAECLIPLDKEDETDNDSNQMNLIMDLIKTSAKHGVREVAIKFLTKKNKKQLEKLGYTVLVDSQEAVFTIEIDLLNNL